MSQALHKARSLFISFPLSYFRNPKCFHTVAVLFGGVTISLSWREDKEELEEELEGAGVNVAILKVHVTKYLQAVPTNYTTC